MKKKSLLSSTLAVATVFTGVASLVGLASAQGMTKVSMVLNWFPEPEAGGFYAAVKDGLYKAKGLDLEILPGGPGVNGTALMASGRVQFATLDSASIMLARDQGIPAVGVFATFQKFPQGLMSHAENPVKTFGDLKGRAVATSPGAAYWQYIEKKYNLAGKVQVVNYNGQLASWLNDPKAITQNYVTSEPFYAQEGGAKSYTLLVANSGFNPYGNLMAVTADYLKANPAVVKAYIEASQEGWKRYLANPAKYNDVMMAANKDLNPKYLAYAAATEKPLIAGGDAVKYGIGYMSEARWNTLLGQLNDLKLLKTTLDIKSLYNMDSFPSK
ncbi:ABC transporter substrate-binding protein [Deinococcus sp.]|uniref:ABC transporter substrate-binding protein n=1 Tax=Deinococcus sp. TaxID=47478 RepID=UPI003CC5CD5A